MRGRIAHLSALCKRFAAVLRRCDAETFLNSGKLFPDLAPWEKRVDMHIALLRKEDFRELECLSDVAKYVPPLLAQVMSTDSFASQDVKSVRTSQRYLLQ